MKTKLSILFYIKVIIIYIAYMKINIHSFPLFPTFRKCICITMIYESLLEITMQ